MLYFLHGTNQQALKDYIFDLKKRAPVVEEIDALTVSADELLARGRTGMLTLFEKKARLIVVANFLASDPGFQKNIIARLSEFTLLPDVFLFFEEQEIKDKTFLNAFTKAGKVQCFDLPKKQTAPDVSQQFLFGCANAWIRGNRAGALRAAHEFFAHGGAPEQLLHMLAAYAKKTKKPQTLLRALRDQFIEARLQKTDLRGRLISLLSLAGIFSGSRHSF